MGDPACWLHLLCTGCGAVLDEPGPESEFDRSAEERNCARCRNVDVDRAMDDTTVMPDPAPREAGPRSGGYQ